MILETVSGLSARVSKLWVAKFAKVEEHFICCTVLYCIVVYRVALYCVVWSCIAYYAISYAFMFYSTSYSMSEKALTLVSILYV